MRIRREDSPLASFAYDARVHDAAFIDAFIAASRRDRWHTLIGGPRRRTSLDRLGGSQDFDPACLTPIASRDQTAAGVLALLRAHAAPADCYLIARDARLDGTSRQLDDALRDLVRHCEPVVISCIPGKLGYLETEPGDRYLLRRAQPR